MYSQFRSPTDDSPDATRLTHTTQARDDEGPITTFLHDAHAPQAKLAMRGPFDRSRVLRDRAETVPGIHAQALRFCRAIRGTWLFCGIQHPEAI